MRRVAQCPGLGEQVGQRRREKRVAKKVLRWLQQDRDYLTTHGLSRPGIREIRSSTAA